MEAKIKFNELPGNPLIVTYRLKSFLKCKLSRKEVKLARYGAKIANVIIFVCELYVSFFKSEHFLCAAFCTSMNSDLFNYFCEREQLFFVNMAFLLVELLKCYRQFTS